MPAHSGVAAASRFSLSRFLLSAVDPSPIDAGDDGVGAGRDGVGVGRERLERAAQLPMAIERRSKARMLNSHARDNRKRSRATNQRG